MWTRNRHRGLPWCAALMVLVSAPWAAAQVDADLAITKGNGRTQVYPGQQVTYVINVTNNGPGDVAGAAVEDHFPGSLISPVWSSTPIGGAIATVGSGTGDLVDTVDIPAGDAIVYTVTAIVDTGVVGTLSNTATVSPPVSVTDGVPDNNSATDTDEVQAQDVANVRPVFDNALPSPNAFATGIPPAANGAAVFCGHVGEWSAPDQARYIMRVSSFGQPLARYKASPTHTEDTLEYTRSQLFYIAGAPSEQNNAAAFRYINTFFDIGTVGTLDAVQMRLDDSLPYDATINPFDGEESDEERAIRVAGEVIDALRFEPFNKDLRHLLLDIYYYRTLGRQVAAKDQVIRAYQINFSTEVSEQEPFGGAINKEIAAFSTAAHALSGVLDPYRELLFNNLGVNISEFDPGFAGDMPFGYYLFINEVPYRSVYAPTFVDYDASSGQLSGNPEPVDLGDTANYSVLYVEPSGFNVDYGGVPTGSQDPILYFNVKNIGTAELDWRASVLNPTDIAGNATDMLSFRDDSDEAVTGVSGSVDVGDTVGVAVHVAKNLSPVLRVGKVRVEDVGSTSSNNLSYDIVIVQEGNDNPIILVSHQEVSLDTVFTVPAFYEEREVVVRNGSVGTLNWTASVVTSGGSTSVDWLKLRGPNDAALGDQATGTNYGVLRLQVRHVYNSPPAPVQVRITGDNPETLPALIDVYFKNNPPPSKSPASVSWLLNVYPEQIYTAQQAVVRNFVVRDAAAFAWSATVTEGGSWLTIGSIDPVFGQVALGIAENTAPASREGVVTVTGVGTSPTTRTVTVLQDGTADTGLSVNPRTRIVSASGGQAVTGPTGTGFFVSRVGDGNVAWSARVTKGQDWLSIYSGTSGQNDGEILFGYDPHTYTDGRTGEILVESADAVAGQNSITVEVIQRGTSGSAVLTVGFKDMALIFDVMHDDADVNKELAKRYALRALQGDLERANNLIGETITRHAGALVDLGSIIPNWRQLVDPSSDLIANNMGWQHAVAELNTVRDFINGDANVLGFQTNFLFLVQEFQGQPADLFDSFDKLFYYLFDGDNNTAVLASPLGYAYDKYLTARAEFDTYMNTQDELREELRTQNLEHRKWMFDVIGVDPGNDVDNPDDAERYRNPSGNYGGQIWQQERSIERSREMLRQNGAELESIYNEINTELWRRSQETQINAQIGDVYITFGDKLASIEEQIGAINAAQAFANQMVEITNAEDAIFSAGASIAARMANAVLQAAMETAKGFLEGDKHQLAAQENQIIRQLEDRILGVNSQALIANLYGRAAVIGVASAELALALAQEIAKRQALFDEWHYLENLMRENNRALLGRSFANPVHRLRMRRAMIEAEASFKVAQQWVFFTIRALEYKWNTPFVHINPAGEWSLASVFRSRTAKDLIDLMAAVRDFDGLMQGSARGDDRFDWFSFKKDFMGFQPVYDTDRETELRLYAHPVTGYAVTATEGFRAKLDEGYDARTGVITLPFSTYRDNGETFFRGPRRDPDDPQMLLSRGQYLDKIVWLKINLLGEFDTTVWQRVSGTLTYSGGSYVRNARVGYIPDPTRPDVIVDEFTRWPTKFWFYDSGLPMADPPVVAAWRSSDEQTTEIALILTNVSKMLVPDSVSQIDVFRERSVSCDNWTLKIFTRENEERRIRIDEIDDIEILFYHVSKDRPELAPLKDGLGE